MRDLVTILSEAVHSGSKDRKDGQDVLGKFGRRTGEMRLAENHDLSTVALNKPFDKLKAEPSQSVAVGNHNCELIAFEAAFQ